MLYKKGDDPGTGRLCTYREHQERHRRAGFHMEIPAATDLDKVVEYTALMQQVNGAGGLAMLQNHPGPPQDFRPPCDECSTPYCCPTECSACGQALCSQSCFEHHTRNGAPACQAVQEQFPQLARLNHLYWCVDGWMVGA